MLTNAQMVEGRYGRWAGYRRQYRWIAERLAEGRTVYFSTALRRTAITAKHLPLLEAGRTGLWLQSGKRRIDCSLTRISAA